MKPPFDFGISQEDPRTEQEILKINKGDHILSIASGGEVPLSLLSLNEHIQITAIDTSLSQIMLCKLKLLSAIHVDFPLNAHFLGYSDLLGSERLKIFNDCIKPTLNETEKKFWEINQKHVYNGVVNSGRFEQYIRKMRIAAALILGRKNLDLLIKSKTIEEQTYLFKKRIASRYILRIIFKIAFHPKIYRKRGLQQQALIHATEDTGQRFFRRFSDFCTGTPVGENYFLQYFLTGKCISLTSYPDYIQPCNKNRLLSNMNRIEFKVMSVRDAVMQANRTYNKIHFSNLGDWMDRDEFIQTIELIKSNCNSGTRICYRYLQKDHLSTVTPEGIEIQRAFDKACSDRFPFYTSFLVLIR